MGRSHSVEAQLPPESREEAPKLDNKYLISVFRDAKKADLELQKEKDSQTPWQDRYTDFVKRRLKETFGDKIPEFFRREDFSRFLENVEYTHNADWPEYFGLVIQEYINGRVHEAHVSEFTDSPEIPETRQKLDDFYLKIAQGGEKADSDLVFIADLLKEAKRAHLKYQEVQGKEVPWASWYAAQLEGRLNERFGAQIPLSREVIEKLLDQAEKMHTAEWPPFYASAIIDEMGSMDALTPEERKEFFALQQTATKVDRIEKIPDQAMRRRYLALNLKRNRGLKEQQPE